MSAARRDTHPRGKQQDDNEPVDFSPQKLLTPTEQRRVLRALARVAQDGAAGRTGANSAALEKDLRTFADTVLGRHTGLQVFMVIDITPEDGPRCVLQVLKIELQVTASGVWQWMLSGRLARKDATLGSVRHQVPLRARAVVKRRRLDATWESIVPKGEQQ